MLTGKSPLTETRDRIQRLSFAQFQKIPSIVALEPRLPAMVVALVQRAMELSPEKRFTGPAAMLVEVRRVIQRLKSGDSTAWAPLGAEARADESDTAAAGAVSSNGADEPAEALEGANRSVMVVESQMEMQDVLREKLEQRGYRVLITNSPARALQRLSGSGRNAPRTLRVV